MALSRRSGNRFQAAIWPGFVDAMTGLLLVLMFVLTIFMVVQFSLRETITGQETRLGELTAEVAALADALGLERDRSAGLQAEVGSLNLSLDEATDAVAQQAGIIVALTQEREIQATQITMFEAQVAGLLAERADAQATIAGLEGAQERLLSEQEALNLALAQARDEIDAGAEEARLAAARREALEALVADLEAQDSAATVRIDDLEAARLVDAAAAEALRARLEDADTELTAMTLNLERQRREAQETLTLLAAAQAAAEDLDLRLAEALLARSRAENELTRALNEGSDLDARLLAALTLQDTTATELAAAQAALDVAAADREGLALRLAAAITAQGAIEDDLVAAQAALDAALAEGRVTQAELEERLAAAVLAQQAQAAELAAATEAGAAGESERARLEDRLAAALLAQERLQAEVASLSEGQSETVQERADLRAQLAGALAAIAASEAQSMAQMTEAERQAALLATANARLSEEQALSAESQRQVAALNEQVAQLRSQIGTLQALLGMAAEADDAAQVQIEALGSQLNAALARVAAEERRRRALEEAERQRLEAERDRLQAEAQDLEGYRSEFFGELRRLLADQEGVRIEGDRFVFSSEVLFEPAQAQLSPEGEAEIAQVARILEGVASDIPANIDWVIRVDGHTDNQPLSGFGAFSNNWELSQARALSVVLYMIEAHGIPPDRLAANGFGEFQPVNPADTPEARAQNRRIELKLTER